METGLPRVMAEKSFDLIGADELPSGSANKAPIAQAPVEKPEPRLYRVIWRWHFYAGLIVMPVLVVAALTGGLYVFKEEIEEITNARTLMVTPQPQRASFDKQLANAKAIAPADSHANALFIHNNPARATEFTFHMTLDEVIAIAEREQGERQMYVSFPHDAGDSFSIFAGNNDSPSTLSQLYVDQYSGKVLETIRWRQLSAVAKVQLSAYPIHIGSIYGLPTKILALLVCLLIVAMSVTGATMWWVRRPKGQSGFPLKTRDFKPAKWLIAVISLFGVFMPAAGISILLILLGDWALNLWRRCANFAHN